MDPQIENQSMHDIGPVMGVFGHLNELRVHVTHAAIALLVTTIIGLIFANQLLEFLLQPYAVSVRGGTALQTLRPTEGIETYFRVSLLAGIVLAMPALLFEFWCFVGAGLKNQEKRYFYIFIPSALVLFGLGLAFAWYVLAPTAIYFLANFMPDVFRAEWTAQEYLSFITRLLLWIGLSFQMPILVYIVARAGLVTAGTMKNQWRVAIVLIAVLAAVITPSVDPVTMLLTMAPLTALYILSIGLAVIGERQFQRSMEEIESRPAV